ncbi:MAG TPA: AMP-binding protein, partial [Candidatus Udaeobacter sp.]|nr:AMP-binding protein [Candidatus Udaeobacter sp.]
MLARTGAVRAGAGRMTQIESSVGKVNLTHAFADPSIGTGVSLWHNPAPLLRSNPRETVVMAQSDITSVLREGRVFTPPPEFSAAAHVKSRAEYEALAREAAADPDAFWARMAGEVEWFQKWQRVLDWENAPFARWFVGGKLNIAHNCLDRHLRTWRKNKAAIIWEGEPGDARVLTYQDLHREVCKFANVLKRQGIRAGDRVAIYMPMIPEIAIAMLACARIGAVHSVVFGGFSAEALSGRINDAQAKAVITADGGYRRGAIVELKQAVDAALQHTPSIERVIVVRRTGHKVAMEPGRDHWWHDLMEDASAECPAEPLDSEHMLYILYT